MMKNETKLIARLRVYFFVSRCSAVELKCRMSGKSRLISAERRWEMTYFFRWNVEEKTLMSFSELAPFQERFDEFAEFSIAQTQTFVIFQLYRKWGQKSNTQKYAKNLLPHRHDNSRHSSANWTLRREKVHQTLKSLSSSSINFSSISTMCKLFFLVIKMKIIYMKLYIFYPKINLLSANWLKYFMNFHIKVCRPSASISIFSPSFY